MKILYSHSSTRIYIGDGAALEQEIGRLLEDRVDITVGARFNTCFSWGSEKKKLIAGLESLSVAKC